MNMMTELATAYPGLMGGMITTLKVLFLAIIGGISLGTVLALICHLVSETLEIPAKLYVIIFVLYRYYWCYCGFTLPYR